MARRRASQLRKIGPLEFAKRMKASASEVEKRYAFFLGAGCSISSGIPAAGRLVRDKEADADWLRKLRDFRAPDIKDDGLDDWARKELAHWAPANPAGSYGELIELLFPHSGDRQREIERLCERKDVRPGFGYAVLTGLMANDKQGLFNVALTTNFDDLIADASIYYHQVRPLVIHHDSLAPFIRPTRLRPMVVKLHGDHQLAPRNLAVETTELDAVVADRVGRVLHDRGLIFVGYGGNDESIIGMLEQLPEEAVPFGVYWVSDLEPRGIFRPWLEERSAMWVDHRDFDELMLLLKKEFDLPDPKPEHFKTMYRRYAKIQAELVKRVTKQSDGPPATQAVKEAAWWLYDLAARGQSERDPKMAEFIYQEGLKACPNSAQLMGNYALFLEDIRHDYDRAEEFYKLATITDPDDGDYFGNYALFLSSVRESYDLAEQYHKSAIELDPEDADHLGNYAVFLQKYRHDYDASEALYERSYSVDPTCANSLGNYAVFLQLFRRRFDQAQLFFERAIDADPQRLSTLNNYAVFLGNVRRDYGRAEKLFMQATAADPDDRDVMADYAQLLFILGRKEEGNRKLNDAFDPKRGQIARDLAIELAFYGYAHGPAEERADRLVQLRELLDAGIRSAGWDLSQNVERALADGHPAEEWLARLAAVICDTEKIDVLASWDAWNEAGKKVDVEGDKDAQSGSSE